VSVWAKATLGNVTNKIGSGATPTGGSNAYKVSGISLIRSQNVLDFRFSNNGLAYIDDEQAHELRNVIVAENDVLLNITGDSVARCCLVPAHVLPARVNQHVAIIRSNPEKSDYGFIYYLLQSMKDELLMQAEIGATRNALTKGMLEKLEISLPSVEEQKSIASVLSSLDYKIDLLHRQNKTLEAMAETLFRQWFVEGAGEWEVGSLADVAVNLKDAVNTSNIAADSNYIGLEHINKRNIALNQNGFGSDVNSNKYAFNKNDILFGKLRPYFHKVCFAPFKGICSTDILVIRPKRPDLFAYCLFAFFQNEVIEYANLGSGGTRMPRTDWGTLKTYPILVPDAYSINKFNKISIPAIEKITSNIEQIKLIEKLRDSLLPKLMSGEVRVS
jgi:type I restriction enzyme, S subunit